RPTGRVMCSASTRGCEVQLLFSRRRRHTRTNRDWSSDVCSSDLVPRVWRGRGQSDRDGGPCRPAGALGPPEELPAHRPRDRILRSEERRVGKEGRTRRAPEPQEKVQERKDGRENTKSRW